MRVTTRSTTVWTEIIVNHQWYDLPWRSKRQWTEIIASHQSYNLPSRYQAIVTKWVTNQKSPFSIKKRRKIKENQDELPFYDEQEVQKGQEWALTPRLGALLFWPGKRETLARTQERDDQPQVIFSLQPRMYLSFISKQKQPPNLCSDQGEPNPEANEDRPVWRGWGTGDAHIWTGVLCAGRQVH